MEIILLFGISILPALFLLWYYDRYDNARPEPRKMLWKAFKWGIIATLFAGVIEQNLFEIIGSSLTNHYLRAFVISFVVAALTEEALKLFVLRKIIWGSKHFDEIMDGIIYAVAASLGFATLENLFYVFEGGIEIGFARAALAVPAHALFSGIMGYYIGKAKKVRLPWEAKKFVFHGFTLAVLYHGLYDFFLMTGSTMVFFVVPLLILMFFQLRHKVNKAHFEDGLTKQAPIPWDSKRTVRFSFGLILVTMSIFYVMGIQMMHNIGQYNPAELPYHIIVLILMMGGAFWAFRRHALPKTQWKKELKIKEDVKKVRG
jgi:protease PrsW